MAGRLAVGLALAATVVVPLWGLVQTLGAFEVCGRALEPADMARMRHVALLGWAMSAFAVGAALWPLTIGDVRSGTSRVTLAIFAGWKLSSLGLAMVMQPPCWESYSRPPSDTGGGVAHPAWVEGLLSLATLVGWGALVGVLFWMMLKARPAS